LFEIHTQDIYWDEHWIFLHAQFKCPDTSQVFADGLTRVMLRHKRDRIHPQRLYRAMGIYDAVDKEEVPKIVQHFLKWDAATEVSMKQTADENAILYSDATSDSFLSPQSMNLPFNSQLYDASGMANSDERNSSDRNDSSRRR
jgi:hypothetical protein